MSKKKVSEFVQPLIRTSPNSISKNVYHAWDCFIATWGSEGKSGFTHYKGFFSSGHSGVYLAYREHDRLLGCIQYFQSTFENEENEIQVIIDASQCGPSFFKSMLAKAEEIWKLDEDCIVSVYYHDFSDFSE